MNSYFKQINRADHSPGFFRIMLSAAVIALLQNKTFIPRKDGFIALSLLQGPTGNLDTILSYAAWQDSASEESINKLKKTVDDMTQSFLAAKDEYNRKFDNQ